MSIKTLLMSGLLAGLGLLQACQSPPPAASGPQPPAWSAPQTQALRELGFQRQPNGDWALNLATSLLFEFDSDQLRPLQQSQLQRLGRGLADLGVPALRVEGHSDSVGEADYNLRLSQRRAAAVARVLGAVGLAGRLQVQGLGSRRPVADNASEAGRAQNRRVVLIVSSL